MRIKKCSYRYTGSDGPVFPKVERGTILTTEGTPMSVTLLSYDEGRGKLVPVDTISKAEIKDGKNGTMLLTGVSALAEGSFGLAQAQVTVEVTPHPNCKNCT